MPRDPGWTHHEVQAYRPKEAAGWLRAEGERHRARFEAGKRAGRLIAAGAMGGTSSRSILLAAAAMTNTSLPADKVAQDLGGGIAAGRAYPWRASPPGAEVPPPDDDNCPAVPA